jgi:4-hydroxythreonine-4-phosphate dehydrogenase
MNNFIFTSGDINGIGPEIVIKSLNRITKRTKNKFIFICPANVFFDNIKIVKPLFDYELKKNLESQNLRQVTILNIGNTKQNLGKSTKVSGRASFKAIELSYKIVKDKVADAIITAPISKTALGLAGINFPGHTEMYAKWTHSKNFVMIFLSKKINTALLTIHEPIRKVPKLLTPGLIKRKINTIINFLKIDLHIEHPKVAILGLNPHAGENGLIGKEEIEIINPIIRKYKSIDGPYSPDAFFGNKAYQNYDMVIGMYHDQVLIPFKLLNFSRGVNFTAGLPIIRTSPDHGTAFNIAGKGIGDETSIYEAYKTAELILKNRNARK